MSRVKEPKHFLIDGPPPQRGGPGDARTFRESDGGGRRRYYEATRADGAHELQTQVVPAAVGG